MYSTYDVYVDRDKLLIELGFPSYSHYLGGELWKSIRERVLIAHPNCPCGKIAHSIYHRSYSKETLTGKDLSKLLPVCSRCRKKIELTSSGSKRSFEQSEARCVILLTGGKDKPIKLRPLTNKAKRLCPCGRKPQKGMYHCRPCQIELGIKSTLPICSGEGCRNQSRLGSEFCRKCENELEISRTRKGTV